MNEANTMSPGGAVQNAPPVADYEHDFRQTIKHGTKIQVN